MDEPDRIDITRLEALAHDLPPVRPGAVLSVDFDFFIRLPAAEEIPAAVRTRAIAALDWTGDERIGAFDAHRQWAARAQALGDLGLDAASLIGIDPMLPPARAVAHLRERLDLPQGCLVADSHAWGLLAVIRAAHATAGPVHLISLDAHHDLGYLNDDEDTHAASRARRQDSVCADDWLAAAISGGWVERATIIYPDWLGLFEWRQEPPTLEGGALQRVDVTTWSDWCAADHRRMQVGSIIAVRSSEWTPPWGGHDAAFLRMVDDLASGITWLDRRWPDARVGAHDARAVRPRVA